MSDLGTVDLPEDPDQFMAALLEWYESNQRRVPWRETRDPYAILVAEVMSQQTQLSRVIPAWERFLERWPTIEALAEAPLADVIEFWSTHRLGYNRRADYLHVAAGQVVAEWEGSVPRDPDDLQTLKGVGPYTGNAVASLAFNTGNAAVDTNVKRVLYRVIPGMGDSDDPPFEAVANELMPSGRSRDWNNAVMELGAMVCSPTPACDDEPCPMRGWCAAYASGDFTAPDVPTQPTFEGSRRQSRGRVLRAVGEHGALELDDLGHRIRVDYAPDGCPGRAWLRSLVEDLEDDGLVQLQETTDGITVRLAGEA